MANSGVKHSVRYGKRIINYTLLYSYRKTLEIAVHPDGSVVVKSPPNSSLYKIEQRVVKRGRWILKQIKFFDQFKPQTPKRCYINGETHLYLGKQYRLKIFSGNRNYVKLYRGFFQISTIEKDKPEIIKNLLNKWYLDKAFDQYQKSFDRCWVKFQNKEFERPTITVKKMSKRWGSISKRGAITLNSVLVKAPKECIDYVVTHELCHLIHKNHSREFYSLLNNIMPNWKRIKHKLEICLV